MLKKASLSLIAVVLLAPALHAQRPAPPPPSGNRIVAQDGDVVVVEDDARVRIVRRRETSVRAVYDPAERWLFLLVDHARPGESPDGRVDSVYYYTNVSGAWPFGARWDGVAAIGEIFTLPNRNTGVELSTAQGDVQLLPSRSEFRGADAAAVLIYSGGGNSSNIGDPAFDDAERWYRSELRRNDGIVRTPDGLTGALSVTAESGIGTGPATVRGPGGAVRVGGSVRPPAKLVDVPAVKPEMAVKANVFGIVIVEITIGTDGTVTDARLLRSIPLLDAAAIEAVRQWRFAPTIVDGSPVPVIMTVNVMFSR